MKKLLLIGLLTVYMQNTLANSNCSITYITGNDNLAAILKGMPSFDFENYDEVCKLLKNANAKVSLTSTSSISNYQTTAVVTSLIMDKNLKIYSSVSYTSMTWDQNRSTPTEKKLLIDTVNNALSGITKEHVDSLNKNRKELGYKSY